METIETDVCIVGGGPAGMCMAVLLAERGIRTLVLERNSDFAREFRGEILQPRFTQLTRQVGLFDHIAGYPHERIERADVFYRGKLAAWFDVAKVAPDAPFILWMTQPTLLGALLDRASRSDAFEMWFDARVTELIEEDQRVAGVRVQRNGESVSVKARVVVGADGRFSSVRKLGRFALRYRRASIDVLWFSVPRPPEHPGGFGFFVTPKMAYLIFPKHPDSLQCGLVLPPGGARRLRKRGVDSLRVELAAAHPVLSEFAERLQRFDQLTYLRGDLALVRRWARDGCLLIGDAAHTCSPVGGVGVSMAMGTAIVAAHVVVEALAESDDSACALDRVQRLREREIRRVHRIQRLVGFAGVRTPGFVRYLGSLAARLVSRTGLVALAVRRLLIERHPLPHEVIETFRDHLEADSPGANAVAKRSQSTTP